MDRFAFVRHKNRHDWNEISDTIKNCLALNNIEDFPEIVQQQILHLDNEEWEDFLQAREEWFSSSIIPLENEV